MVVIILSIIRRISLVEEGDHSGFGSKPPEPENESRAEPITSETSAYRLLLEAYPTQQTSETSLSNKII